jgi:hypothetical protein
MTSPSGLITAWPERIGGLDQQRRQLPRLRRQRRDRARRRRLVGPGVGLAILLGLGGGVRRPGRDRLGDLDRPERAASGQQRRKAGIELRRIRALDAHDADRSTGEIPDQPGDVGLLERHARQVENQRLAVEETGRADQPIVELAQPLGDRQRRPQHQGQEVSPAEAERMTWMAAGDCHDRGPAAVLVCAQQRPASLTSG